MTLSGRLLLPKLSELNGLPDLIKNMYFDVQCNDSIDAIWEGAAVIFNTGAAKYIEENGKYAGWFSSYEVAKVNGGLDNRIGIITQYEDSRSVNIQNGLYGMDLKPWVRVSCFMECQLLGFKRNVCHFSSVSLDARFCTTIPMSILIDARQQTINKVTETSRFIENLILG